MPNLPDGKRLDSIALRPVCDEDVDFLRDLYACTRDEELTRAGLDPAQCKAFTDMQFAAQSADYRRRYPNGNHDIILLGEKPIGRLYVGRSDAEIRILDVTILPDHRGAGLGSYLLGQLLDEARESSRRIQIYLDNDSPAVRLFERLGFVRIERQDLISLYEWRPSNP